MSSDTQTPNLVRDRLQHITVPRDAALSGQPGFPFIFESDLCI
jgi:hypothetical protein